MSRYISPDEIKLHETKLQRVHEHSAVIRDALEMRVKDCATQLEILEKCEPSEAVRRLKLTFEHIAQKTQLTIEALEQEDLI